MPFIQMDKKGKKEANKILNEISIGGGTNLWDGLEKSIEHIAQQESLFKEENFFSLILTDGEPNQNRKTQYKKKKQYIKFSLQNSLL
jgi:Mg-chelatase subunit ChlD